MGKLPSASHSDPLIHGVKTHILTAGAGDPLILLHGAGGDGSLFDGILPALAADRRTLAPDLPGHGSSGGLRGLYTIGKYLGWLDALVDEIGPPVTLLGHSLGGALAMRYASRNPSKIKHLVIVDPIALGWPRMAATLRLVRALFTREAALARARMGEVMFAGDEARRSELVATYLGGQATPPSGLHGFLWMFIRTWHAAMPLSQRELTNIQAPVRILWGACDGYFPPSHAQRAMAAIARSSLALIPDAGHAPFLEQPAMFVDLVGQAAAILDSLA